MSTSTSTSTSTTGPAQVDVRGPRFAAWVTTVVLLAVLIVSAFSTVAAAILLAAQAVVLGSVTIGAYSVLGANSTCRDGITIGSGCIIGAGATMTRSAPDRGVYVSRPAERLAKSSDVLADWLNWPVR